MTSFVAPEGSICNIRAEDIGVRVVLVFADGCRVTFRLPPGEVARVVVGKQPFDTEMHDFDGADPVLDASAEAAPVRWVPAVIDGGKKDD